jgi:hypothetical protein
MFFYQYIILAGLTCLFFNKETRFASLAFLVGWCVYALFLSGDNVSTASYYIGCAAIETAIAYSLTKKHRLVAYLGYSLIPVNIFGLLIYKSQSAPLAYDAVYAVISIAQLLILIARANVNGINRLHIQHFLVRVINFDSYQARDIMSNNKATKKAYQ